MDACQKWISYIISVRFLGQTVYTSVLKTTWRPAHDFSFTRVITGKFHAQAVLRTYSSNKHYKWLAVCTVHTSRWLEAFLRAGCSSAGCVYWWYSALTRPRQVRKHLVSDTVLLIAKRAFALSERRKEILLQPLIYDDAIKIRNKRKRLMSCLVIGHCEGG